jgi:choline dehydrogenase-like flavoprotein
MGADPARSVVDADGRAHDVSNLFVAGSSVFPREGTANPTSTLAALPLRTADVPPP